MKQTTQNQLEWIVIDEFDKIEECRGVISISFYTYSIPGHPQWKPSIINFGEAHKAACLRAMPEIVKRLQAEYVLIKERAA